MTHPPGPPAGGPDATQAFPVGAPPPVQPPAPEDRTAVAAPDPTAVTAPSPAPGAQPGPPAPPSQPGLSGYGAPQSGQMGQPGSSGHAAPPGPIAPAGPFSPPGQPSPGSAAPFAQPQSSDGRSADPSAPLPYGQQPPPPAAPAGATGPPNGRSRRSPLRILGRAIVVLAVVGALAGTTAWGFVNRSSAEKWRDRSEAADADLVRALERVETSSTEVTEARDRLRELANEKAGETDRNRVLADIVSQAPEVTAALAECQSTTAALANQLIAALSQPAPDTTMLRRQTTVVNDLCASALSQAEALEASIDALG